MKTLEYRLIEHDPNHTTSAALDDTGRPDDVLYDLVSIDEEMAEEFTLLVMESHANGDQTDDWRVDVVCGVAFSWRIVESSCHGLDGGCTCESCTNQIVEAVGWDCAEG